MLSIADDERAEERCLGQDQDRISQEGLVGHAASCSGAQLDRRSAMASRTSASWQIATIAVPRAFASLTMAMTIARFAASSDGGRLVEQQDRVPSDEAARKIHALLFTTGEGRRRKGVQPARDIQPEQQIGGNTPPLHPASSLAAPAPRPRHQAPARSAQRAETG